jgi:hypothetical protein
MPHFKCVTCRTRLSTTGPAEFDRDLCPGCGSPYEPVVELTELVGFRAVIHRGIHDSEPAIAQAVAMPRPDTT